MKLETDQTADVKGLIKNEMDLDAYYIPKLEGARVEKNTTMSMLLQTRSS